MTKGVGLLMGPLAVGAVIDIFHSQLESTDGTRPCGRGWHPRAGCDSLVVLLVRAEASSLQARRRVRSHEPEAPELAVPNVEHGFRTASGEDEA